MPFVKTFQDELREQHQDSMEEHRNSPENELRRKRGLSEKPFNKQKEKTPEEIAKNKKRNNQILKRVLAEYLKDLNKGI